MVPVIVADEKIPLLDRLCADFGALESVAADRLGRHAKLADILLVRSVTTVDAALLEGTRVQWVGSATAGLDHVDREYLQKRGIVLAHAPGANARAVAEYVIAAVSLAAIRIAGPNEAVLPWWGPQGLRWGVVGFGQVGRRLVQVLRSLGCPVRVCDPPLQRQVHPGNARANSDPWRAMVEQEPYCSLDELLPWCDVLTLHVPLHREGRDSTFHMLDAGRLAALRPDTLLINTSRGAVIDHRALGTADSSYWVLDVWEGEPNIDSRVLMSERLLVATPHVAGHTREAKTAASRMLHLELAQFLGRSPAWCDVSDGDFVVPQPATSHGSPALCLALLLDDVVGLTGLFRDLRSIAALPSPSRSGAFERLRLATPARREFANCRIHETAGRVGELPTVLSRLGFPDRDLTNDGRS